MHSLSTCNEFCTFLITVPSAPQSNDDDYDLIIPRLVLFVVIPFVIVLVLMVVIPVATVWAWRLYKLRRMKDRLTIAEAVRTGDDTLEQGRLTRGTFHNTHADTSFSVNDQTLPQSQQTSPAPPRSQASPYVPGSPAPPPPASYQRQPPQPPLPPQPRPPPEFQSNMLQSTSQVVVDVEIPYDMPPAHVIGDRTSTMSGAFDVLAAVTAAEAKKRHSTVGNATSIKRSNSSAFRQWERPTTPPPPPPPPANGAPVIPPKPNSPIRHLMDQHPVDGEEDLPNYESIPGAQQDDYEVITIHQVTTSGNDDEDDTYDDVRQLPVTSDQYDTYDVPTPYPNSASYDDSTSVPPPRPPKPGTSQNPLDKLVQEDPLNQTPDLDREISNLSQDDVTYEVLDLNDND